MYIDTELIIRSAAVITALGVLVGAIFKVVHTLDHDRIQSAQIMALQEEQTEICYGLLACLKGLKEQGCNGPVTDALNHLEKHLNQKAHQRIDF